MLGGVLAQQEHMLRSTRLEHWSFEAVLHMDALVQLYEQLMSQVRRSTHLAPVCVPPCWAMNTSVHGTPARLWPLLLQAAADCTAHASRLHPHHALTCLGDVVLQVTTPGAAAWLLTLFGVQVSSSRAAGPLPSAAGSGGGSSSNNSGGNYSPGPAAPLPSDSLQLVLTFLQSYLTAMAAAADSCSMVPAEPAASALLSPSLKAVSRAGGSSTPAPALTAADSAAAGCGAANRGSELSPSVLSALGQMGQPPSSGGVLVMQLKANCWRLLGRLLLLAAQQPALRTQGELWRFIQHVQDHSTTAADHDPVQCALPLPTHAPPATHLSPCCCLCALPLVQVLPLAAECWAVPGVAASGHLGQAAGRHPQRPHPNHTQLPPAPPPLAGRRGLSHPTGGPHCHC